MKAGIGRRLSLLLVEDSPADVFLIKEAMREAGLDFHLDVADDGEAAIRILDQVDSGSADHPPDLLLVDLNVPRKDGTKVLERLRRSPRFGKIPVVMLSSSDAQHDRERAFELGANEYFCKPSTLAEFMQLGTLVRRLAARGPSPQDANVSH
jgi:two-component system, chemotaxis family, response regulator Rcp1